MAPRPAPPRRALPRLWLLGLVPLRADRGARRRLRRARRRPGSASAAGRRSRSSRSSAPCCSPGMIELTVRNDGPDAVAIAQVVVNDAFAQFTARDEPIGRLATDDGRDRSYPWVEGEAYEVSLLTSTGGDDRARDPGRRRDARRRRRLLRADGAARHLRRRHPGRARDAAGCRGCAASRRRGCASLMALTVGLLALPAIDATLEGLELAGQGSQAFGGAALVFSARSSPSWR